jgi:hypothetical protein
MHDTKYLEKFLNVIVKTPQESLKKKILKDERKSWF